MEGIQAVLSMPLALVSEIPQLGRALQFPPAFSKPQPHLHSSWTGDPDIVSDQASLGAG